MSFCAWGGGILGNQKNTKDEREESVFAIYVDNIEQTKFPSLEDGSIFDPEKSYCDNGALLEWDNDTWSPIIKNVTTTRTKCHFYFTKELWKQWILEAKVDDQATTLNEFLENSAKVSAVFESKEATTFLLNHPKLIDEIKATPSYLDTSNMSEETSSSNDLRSDVVKIILNSTILTNEQKYQHGLPFYIFQNGSSFSFFVNYRWAGYTIGTLNYNNSISNSINLSLTSHPNACATQNYYSKDKVDISKYKMFSTRYHIVNTTSNYHSVFIGIGSALHNDYGFMFNRGLSTSGSGTGWISSKVNDMPGEYYFGVRINSCYNGSTSATTSATVYEWYMY